MNAISLLAVAAAASSDNLAELDTNNGSPAPVDTSVELDAEALDTSVSDLDSSIMESIGDESKTERQSRGKWSAKEDGILKYAVTKHGGRNWKRIADYLEGRSDVQCLHRWQKVLRPGLVKGPWTREVSGIQFH